VSTERTDAELAAVAAAAIRNMVLARDGLELAAHVQQLLAAVLEYRATLAEPAADEALRRAIQRRAT
jgi:hypothetical protein